MKIIFLFIYLFLQFININCQEICKIYEQYYEHIPVCPNTCELYIIRDRIRCSQGPPGCFCKEGLVKRKDGKCIPLEYCS
jgi:hypothetical protein